LKKVYGGEKKNVHRGNVLPKKKRIFACWRKAQTARGGKSGTRKSERSLSVVL